MSRCRGWSVLDVALPVMAMPTQEDLRAVTVRPTGARRSIAGTGWWRSTTTYRLHRVIGKGLRHVAVHGETLLLKH